ncbi:MAG TPA: glycosyltransferase family 2 protein [Bacteroidales bacterium]|nr:glycosyltransferase family 2 protein [Bacteroidales bacterium]
MVEKLTIALPVYKRTDYIREALDSAINQTVKCSVLLIDNNSPHHDFKDILDSYNYPHAKYVRTDETVPQDENFNNCFRHAETPWVTILHDDDMLHCQFAEFTGKILDEYGERAGGIVFKNYVSDKVWQDLDKKVRLTDDIRLVKEAFFYFSQLTPFPGVVLRNETALKLGGFKSELHPIADFDFWYRYSTTERMLMVNQMMAYYRISPAQSTNHLIDAMINNIYSYRLGLIEEGRHNNFMSKLALEASRINNIHFFENTYPDIRLPEKITNEDKMQQAEKILKNNLVRKVVRRYKETISFGKP